MNNPEAYTHLETLLLWESILRDGVDPSAWLRISEKLTNNEYIKQSPSYNAARLKVEPLQTQLFRTLQVELDGRPMEEITSPGGTKKRKLDGNAPLPGLKELAENLDFVPVILNRLWERYKQHQIQAIRDDETAYEKTSLEVMVLEKNEKSRLENLSNKPTQTTLAPKETKPTVPPTGANQSPVTTPAQAAAPKRGPTPNTPVVPPKPPTPIAAPSHLPAGTPPTRPTPPAQPSNGTGGVLQPPSGPPPQQPSRVLQAPSPAPKVPISPRPDAAKPKENAPPRAPAAPPAQGQLNWQTPYQPPGPAQTPQRQTQSPGPQRAATPQQYAQHQQQWHQQQTQQQQQQYPQGQVTAPQQQPPQHPQQASPQPGKPPLAPPQNAGQMVPQIQPGPPRPTGAAPSPQPRPQSKTPVPHPHRPIQPHQPQIQQPRPIAASPSPQSAQGGFVQPPQAQRWPQGHVPPHTQGQRISPAVSPAPPSAQGNKPAASPYAPPRPAIPEHMIRHAASTTPQARRASAAAAGPPTTPLPQLNLNLQLVRGFGTKWAPQSTPSTPRPLVEEPASPAYETISPPLRPATLPRSTTVPASGKSAGQIRQPALPATAPKGKRTRKLRDVTGTPSADARRRSESVASGADELSMDYPEAVAKVKNEEATPRPNDEIGDTTADESTSGRPFATPGTVSRILKRKRQETPLEPPGPPTHVLWTRGFTKVSSSAIEHISSHKNGNMFASAIRDKDAPNYSQIVLQPQSINSIRSAVKSGHKAATQAANALSDGDPGTASVWLPISEDLTPPKGIINSGQLEREVMHMLSNAIMYNPDPDKGVSREFLKATAQEESDAVGYRVDENAFVRDTRAMFVEVEQNLSDLRSAEKDHTGGGPPPQSTPRTGGVGTPADDTAEEEDELAADGDNATSGTAKRRRTGTARA